MADASQKMTPDELIFSSLRSLAAGLKTDFRNFRGLFVKNWVSAVGEEGLMDVNGR